MNALARSPETTTRDAVETAPRSVPPPGPIERGVLSVTFRHLGDLDGLPGSTGLAGRGLVDVDPRIVNGSEKLATKIMAGNDVEGLTLLIEFEDAAAIGLREIHRVARDCV